MVTSNSFDNFAPKKLRIAQVSPLWESVPPPKYGGVEKIVSLLTEELHARGHEVTLFASGDSITQAKLQAMAPQALRNKYSKYEYPRFEVTMMRKIFAQQADFDVIHFHDRCVSFFFSEQLTTPSVHTLHYSVAEEFHELYAEFPTLNYVNISQAQARLIPHLQNRSVIYNGIEIDDYPFALEPARTPYLLFLGRMVEVKGPHLAIQVAQRSGLPLKLVGKVDDDLREFFDTEIKPHLDGNQIEYVGEVSHEEKVELLRGAIATLFPILWNEPFGLVMVESMACGTPVIGMNRASVPEIVADGKTGFICNTLDDLVAATQKINQINRYDCHQWAQERFSVKRMVDDYETFFLNLLICKTVI